MKQETNHQLWKLNPLLLIFRSNISKLSSFSWVPVYTFYIRIFFLHTHITGSWFFFNQFFLCVLNVSTLIVQWKNTPSSNSFIFSGHSVIHRTPNKYLLLFNWCIYYRLNCIIVYEPTYTSECMWMWFILFNTLKGFFLHLKAIILNLRAKIFCDMMYAFINKSIFLLLNFKIKGCS